MKTTIKDNTYTIKIESCAEALPKMAEFRNKMTEALKFNKIIIDFADIEFVGTGTLDVFSWFVKAYNNSYKKVKLINMNEDVLHMFNITGFSNFFLVGNDE